MKRIRLSMLALLVLASTASASEHTVKFSVPGMTCPLCPITVRTAIGKVPGVKSVTTDFDAKSATVIFDDAKTTPQAIAEASANAGYPVNMTDLK